MIAPSEDKFDLRPGVPETHRQNVSFFSKVVGKNHLLFWLEGQKIEIERQEPEMPCLYTRLPNSEETLPHIHGPGHEEVTEIPGIACYSGRVHAVAGSLQGRSMIVRVYNLCNHGKDMTKEDAVAKPYKPSYSSGEVCQVRLTGNERAHPNITIR